MFIVALEEDGIIKLYSVKPLDKVVERIGPTFAARDEVDVVSSSGANFPSENVYASSGDSIHEISTKGATVRVFATPSEGSNIEGLVFDNRGYWNYRLIAVTDDGVVWEIDKSGNVERIADLGDNAVPSGITVAPDEFGEFSGHVLVSIKNENRVVAISHKDHSVNVLAELPGEIPGSLRYIFPNADIYITEKNKDGIVKVDRAIVQDNLAQVLVVTEGEMDGAISLVAIKSSRAGVDITEIVSDFSEPDIEGITFVLDNELTEALKGEPEEVVEINPLFIIFPVLIIVVVVSFLVIWRYRGF